MSKGYGPFFMDFDFNGFQGVEKAFAAFKVPMAEGQSLAEAQRRNVEALTRANQVVFEGMQAIAQRQGEIARQAVSEFTAALNDLAGAGTVEDRLARQTELVKDGYEQAVSNARELAEISVKSQSEAVDLLNQRVTETLDEVRTALSKTAH